LIRYSQPAVIKGQAVWVSNVVSDAFYS